MPTDKKIMNMQLNSDGGTIAEIHSFYLLNNSKVSLQYPFKTSHLLDIMEVDSRPYERRLNTTYLVIGYSRECKKSSYIPSSVSDLITCYCPSMNGHSFLWKIKNINEDDPFQASVDSDVFDIGLSNKFLRLESNVYGIQRSGALLSRDRSRRRERGGDFQNNVESRPVSSVQLETAERQRIAEAYDDDMRNTRDDMEVQDDDKENVMKDE